MLIDAIIADGDLWEGLAVLILAIVGGIVNHFATKAKEKREREKFEQTGAALGQKPKTAPANDDTGWQRVSVVQSDLAAFLQNAKRNRTKLQQQKTKKRFADYHSSQPQPAAEAQADEDQPPHLNIAPLPSHDKKAGLFHQNTVSDTPQQPAPIPIPAPRKITPAARVKKKYVFQHDEPPHIHAKADEGESVTHRIVADAAEPESLSEPAEGTKIAAGLKNKNDLRQAFILSEILAKPLSLRKESLALWDF